MVITTQLIVVVIILAVFAGVILLQIFLSKKESRVLGLILPLLTGLCSLAALLRVAVGDAMSAWDIFCALALTFLLANIPTLILLAVYFACKDKSKRKKQLEKMNIQDLN